MQKKKKIDEEEPNFEISVALAEDQLLEGARIHPITDTFGHADLNILRDKINEIIKLL